MYRLILFLCFSIHALALSAQKEVNYSAIVLNAYTQEPVSYANVLISGTQKGVSTNEVGYFELKNLGRSKDSLHLKISALGYRNYLLTITNQLEITDTLLLQPKSYELNEIIILDHEVDANKLLREAIKSIPDNYLEQPHLMSAFYRHYCKEDDKYGRLIEAAFSVFDKKGHKKIYNDVGDKFDVRLDEIRRSYDFTKFSTYNHLPIAMEKLLNKDISSLKTLLHRIRWFTRFEFERATLYDEEIVYVIEFNKGRSSSDSDTLNISGRLYITAETKAIIRTEVRVMVTNKTGKDHRESDIQYEVSYRKLGSRYALANIKESGVSRVFFEGQDRFIHRHNIELMINNIEFNAELPRDLPPLSRDYMLTKNYNPIFWKTYSLLKATPLEEEIIQDLSSKLNLDYQFRNYNNFYAEPGNKDSVFIAGFKNMLSMAEGKNLYIAFMETNNSFNTDLKLLQKLRDAHSIENLSIILITHGNEYESKQLIKKVGTHNIQTIFSPLSYDSRLFKKYHIYESRQYLYLNENGEVIDYYASDPDNLDFNIYQTKQ